MLSTATKSKSGFCKTVTVASSVILQQKTAHRALGTSLSVPKHWKGAGPVKGASTCLGRVGVQLGGLVDKYQMEGSAGGRRGFYGVVKGTPLKLGDVMQKKKEGKKITMLTAYDKMSAEIADAALLDFVLVGDSLANVVLGYAKMSSVDIDTMLYHCKSVSRGVQRALVVGDMPFGTYMTVEDALLNSRRFVQEGGANMVKLEGCEAVLSQIRAVSQFVPVCAHIGVQPQTADNKLARGKVAEDAEVLLEEALAVQEAGASLLVLEKVCVEVAGEISRRLRIPTIGIGAGPDTDGQVLVWHDVLGLIPPGGLRLKFVKTFGNVWDVTEKAVEGYARAVERKEFPTEAHSFFMHPNEETRFRAKLAEDSLSKSQSQAVSPIPPSEVVPIRNVLVMGSGGMGSWLGYLLGRRFTKEGVRVIVASNWDESIRAMQQRGGIVKLNATEAEALGPVDAMSYSEMASSVPNGSVDMVAMCMKSNHTSEAAALVAPKLRADGRSIVLSMQNGMEAASVLMRLFTPRQNRHKAAVVLGTSTYGFKAKEVGKLEFEGTGMTQVGPAEVQYTPQADQVAAMLRDAGIKCQLLETHDLRVAQWEKIAQNACINSLTTLFDVPNGGLSQPVVETLLRQITEEIYLVARSRGIAVSPPEELLAKVRATIDGTAINSSSMRHDVRERKVGSEIRAICGAVVKEAAKGGMQAPINEFLTNAILAIEAMNSSSDATGSPKTVVLRRPKEVIQTRNALPANRRVIFVPFLGGLHEGHFALVDFAKRLDPSAEVWCSVFLNKLQFQRADDYSEYPMNLEEDIRSLEMRGVSKIFAPSLDDMHTVHPDCFPPRVSFMGVEDVEGESRQRPGFFGGIGTVCTKFFSWVRPDVVVFGQKDYQQTVMIRRLVEEFFPAITVAIHPTVREADGLACSSRNRKLKPEERARAPLSYEMLRRVEAAFQRGEMKVANLLEEAKRFAADHDLKTNYITIYEENTGRPMTVDSTLDPSSKYCAAAGVAISDVVNIVDNVVLEGRLAPDVGVEEEKCDPVITARS